MKERHTGDTPAVLALVCLMGVGLMVAGCPTPPAPPAACTTDADCAGDLNICIEGACTEVACVTDADCAENQVCNATHECEDVPAPECTIDADCDEGEFCNDDGDCEALVDDAYTTNAFTDDQEALHAAHADADVSDCTTCHHSDPPAGFVSCTDCHDDDPNEFNSFKEVAHDQNESGDGCRLCHADEWEDNCAFCHTALAGE